VHEKRTIVHMYFNLGKEVAEIAASIPSPRQPAPATICERTVKIILNEYVRLTEVTPPETSAQAANGPCATLTASSSWLSWRRTSGSS